MKRQKVLFLKQNYILRILKRFMFTGLFIIALLLILVHKVDLGIISGLSKAILYTTAPIIKVATIPADVINYIYKKLVGIFYLLIFITYQLSTSNTFSKIYLYMNPHFLQSFQAYQLL